MVVETLRSARPVPRSSKRLSRMQRHIALTGMIFVAPAVIYVLIFNIFPVIYAFYLSFTNYNPLDRQGPQLQGLDNYRAILASDQFWNALRVTTLYTIEVLPPSIILAIALALLANKPLRGIGLFRAMFYLPRIVSLAAVSLIWLWLYSDHGILSYLASFFGGGVIGWLTSPALALSAVAVMRIWKSLGGNMVLFLAALQGIPQDLYEAAAIDGAGRWAKTLHVTLPGLRPMIVYVTTINIVYLFQSFSELYIMTQGGPVESTTTVNILIYNQAFQYNQLGQASATAFLLFAVIFIFAFFNIRLISARRTAS
ncbi:MAG TPA: sugar ABC transporter permease [Ktedonobacteraceae bacterium]|jgi:multiple sugar transport system permease protein|nr:sugar ABC transporter permease [Ktedonobacteraceae bacterium]